MTNIQSKSTKILIMGLDNSGKTSIVLSLSQNTDLPSYCRLKPTQGANIVTIEENNLKFNIWDLGGQKEYRLEYLDNLDKYLYEVDRFIYVIDVQDAERYDIALQYLKSVIEGFKNKYKGVDFSIFLHKYDPIFEMRSNFNKNVDEKLIKPIKKLIPSDCNCKIYRTSIYTVFKKNLVP
ncbi:MAG: ADP-ribosylation factor-like protein [Promethearchaeota archaeon]